MESPTSAKESNSSNSDKNIVNEENIEDNPSSSNMYTFKMNQVVVKPEV